MRYRVTAVHTHTTRKHTTPRALAHTRDTHTHRHTHTRSRASFGMLLLAHPNIVAVLHKHETVETLSGGHQIEVGEIGMCERFFARDAIRWCVHEQILRPRKGGGSGERARGEGRER